MWNPFKKTNSGEENENAPSPSEPSVPKMGMLERLAMKKFMSMSDQEKQKLMQKMMTPENIAKNKDKILQAMEQMKASGMASDEQIEMAKKQMGL